MIVGPKEKMLGSNTGFIIGGDENLNVKPLSNGHFSKLIKS